MMRGIVLALIASLWASVAFAQGNQCRTAPVGTSTPNCASEAFVTSTNTGNVKGPNSSTTGHVATFADTTGKLIADGGAPATGTVTEQKNTASAGLTTSGNCDNTSTNASSPCNTARALNEATLQASPANPTGTGNVTGLMMGLGSTCHITPTYSSRINVEFRGSGAVTTATASFTVQLRFGTGTAPANAAVITGTAVGNARTGWSAVANAVVPFPAGGIITGLTPGTAYWFDLSLAVSAGTGTLSGLDCTAMEF